MPLLTLLTMSVEDALLSIWQRNIPMSVRVDNLRRLCEKHGYETIYNTLDSLAARTQEERELQGDIPDYIWHNSAA